MASPYRVAISLNLEWPYKRHAEIFAGTQRYAQEQGWETFIDEYVAETLPLHSTKKSPYDGVICRASRKLAERAARLGVPVVNVWFTSPVANELPGVFPDFAAGGRLRAEHLLTRGVRRFAVMGREDRGSKVETNAFSAAVRAAGFACLVQKLPLHTARNFATWQKTERCISTWMEMWHPPLGVFVYSDDIGRMVAQMCIRRGWRVPEDVAIIAGSNEETICLHPRPSLTSLERGYEQIGVEAAKLLHQLMDAKKRPQKKAVDRRPQHVFLPPKGLMVRESTDFFVVDDPLVAAALSFIATNCHRSIGQDDVAKAVNAETRTLQIRFRKVLDRPIVAVIRGLRIERAQRELAHSDRSMQEIARDVGFGNALRMCEVFRRELGETPTEYRNARQLSADR